MELLKRLYFLNIDILTYFFYSSNISILLLVFVMRLHKYQHTFICIFLHTFYGLKIFTYLLEPFQQLVLPNYLVSIEKQRNMIQALYGRKSDTQANVILKPDLCVCKTAKLIPKWEKLIPTLKKKTVQYWSVK